jgi:O-antigen ligase
MEAPALVAPPTLREADLQSSRSVLGPIVFYGTLGLLLFGPLAFGAVESWSIFVLQAGATVLFLLWAMWQAASGELRILGSPLFLPMLAFAILVAVQLATGRTSYPWETKSIALLYCTYGLICFLTVQILRQQSQVEAAAWLVSGYGAALAIFALIQSFASNGKLYWLRKPSAGGWIYGPYVNHNHYAGLMEMLIPIPLVVALVPSVPMARRGAAGVAAALMASTVFLSGSRGGMVALAVEMVILAGVLARRGKGRKLGLVLGAFVVLVVVLLTWLGGGELTTRLASMRPDAHPDVSGTMRLNIDRDAVKMFTSKPVLGWGLGVFPTIYPQYRSFYTSLFVNQAHNDYLQLLVEMGALGFAAMLWFIGISYYRGIRKMGNWSRDPNGAVALAALLGITGILVHSWLDFNLQIPANAAFFYVLCVVAAMKPRFGTSSRMRARRHRPDSEGQLSA